MSGVFLVYVLIGVEVCQGCQGCRGVCRGLSNLSNLLGLQDWSVYFLVVYHKTYNIATAIEVEMTMAMDNFRLQDNDTEPKSFGDAVASSIFGQEGSKPDISASEAVPIEQGLGGYKRTGMGQYCVL